MRPPQPCDICGSTQFRTVYRDHPLLDGPLVRCLRCGVLQVNPRSGRYLVTNGQGPQERMSAYASQSEAVRQQLRYSPDLERQEAGVRHLVWQERLRRIRRYTKGGKLLEVGAAQGQFLAVAREAGYEVSGVEPLASSCALASKLYGVNVLPVTLEEARLPDAEFDVICMFHVIEHVSSPSGLVHEANRVLKPNGILVIEFPCEHGLFPRLMGGKWRQFIPDHYWFFSLQNMRAFLKNQGLEVLELRSVPKAVSLRLLANRLSRISRTAGLAALALSKLLGGARHVWINPGDIGLAIARKPGNPPKNAGTN
ncbi:MAG: methyltransferase domain-containing protein [Anaerolineae bacterium]